MIPAQNLQLARELFAHFLEQRNWVLEQGNAEIAPLLDGGDEYEVDFLPGDSIDAIKGNLKKAIDLASKPAPMPTTGRNRARLQAATDLERKQIVLFARAALVLIEGESPAPESRGAEAVDVLRGIQAMTSAYLRAAHVDVMNDAGEWERVQGVAA